MDEDAMLKDWMERIEKERAVIRRYKMLDVMLKIIKDSGADNRVILGFEICKDFLNKGEII